VIVLIAVAAICLALIAALKPKDPIRPRESGPISWRGGRRQLTEEEAARLVRERLRDVD
jgi:hypothetical protein